MNIEEPPTESSALHYLYHKVNSEEIYAMYVGSFDIYLLLGFPYKRMPKFKIILVPKLETH